MPTISDPLDRLRYLLARSATWRVWCGITTGTEEERTAAAVARTYRRFTFELDAVTRPFAVVYGMPNENARRVASGGGVFIKDFDLYLHIAADFTDTHADVVAERVQFDTFEENLIDICNEMDALSGSGQYLKYENRAITTRLSRTDPEADIPMLFAVVNFKGELQGSESV